jgi:hypothetical protein
MAEDEAQAERDRFVELRRKLEAKGLSVADAVRHAAAMCDHKKMVDWLEQTLGPEEQAAFVQMVLNESGMDIDDLTDADTDDKPRGH